MYSSLTPDELMDKDGSDAREQFMASIYERLGSQVLPKELEDLGLENTPQYDLYEDKTQNKQAFPQLAEELKTMQEMGDHYIGVEILLPRGDETIRDHVVVDNHDANGKIMERAHTSSLLDTRMYQVELQSKPRMPLLNQCTPYVMQMGMSIYS